MAPGTRGNPNCAKASNPYHECTQACLQPNKTTTTKSSLPNKNIKTRAGGYGRSVTDGELGKKVNNNNEERGRGKQQAGGCPKASNPYHNCDDHNNNCNYYKTLSSASSVGGKYESKRQKAASNKAVEVEPPPPVKNAADVMQVVEAQYSGGEREIILQEPAAPVKEQQVLMNSNDEEEDINIKVAATASASATASHDEAVAINPITTSAAAGSASAEDDAQDSSESPSSSSRNIIAVGGYNVKESFGAILRSILHKYGDIGATCKLESLVMRSYYVECVCFVVQELQQSASAIKLKELSAVLKDVESAQLRVAWLRSVLDELAQVESLREELHSQLQTLSGSERTTAC